MKVLLLTKKSVFQAYCANYLTNKKILTHTIIEKNETGLKKSLLIKHLFKFNHHIKKPMKFIIKILIFLNYKKYYGNKSFHNKRILNNDNDTFSNFLKLYHCENINNDSVNDLINKINPSIIFVLGTTMITNKILNNIFCPIINMHTGWSPNYRGEGIISALANNGSKDLGVTVHYIDEKSDAGNIIYQSRLKIDKDDNFYSISLKLIKIGTELFEKVFEDFKKKSIISKKQNLDEGKLYSRKFMDLNPEIYFQAWKNLNNERENLTDGPS